MRTAATKRRRPSYPRASPPSVRMTEAGVRRHRWRSVRVVTRLRPWSRAWRTVADLVDLRVQRAHPRPHVASVPDVPGVVGEVRAQEKVAPLVGREAVEQVGQQAAARLADGRVGEGAAPER